MASIQLVSVLKARLPPGGAARRGRRLTAAVAEVDRSPTENVHIVSTLPPQPPASWRRAVSPNSSCARFEHGFNLTAAGAQLDLDSFNMPTPHHLRDALQTDSNPVMYLSEASDDHFPRNW